MQHGGGSGGFDHTVGRIGWRRSQRVELLANYGKLVEAQLNLDRKIMRHEQALRCQGDAERGAWDRPNPRDQRAGRGGLRLC